MHSFQAQIEKIGVNPFVFVPADILAEIFMQAGKDKGHIPIHGVINGRPYRQTLVKFRGHWRLYINTTMLKNSPNRTGETVSVSVAYDPSDRTIQPHPELVKALGANQEANAIFKALRPSLRHEIVRYIANLKTEENINKNVSRAINFLLGNERFIGRDKP